MYQMNYRQYLIAALLTCILLAGCGPRRVSRSYEASTVDSVGDESDSTQSSIEIEEEEEGDEGIDEEESYEEHDDEYYN